MNRLTHGKRDLIRTMILAMSVALLAGSMTQRDAGANQSGNPVAAGTLHSLICRSGGGTEWVSVDRSVGYGVTKVTVLCFGGLWDNMFCQSTIYVSTCTFAHLARPDEASDVLPTGGNEVVPEVPRAAPATADEVAEDAAPAEVPATDEPAVTDDVVAPTGPAEDPATDDTVPTNENTVPPAPAEDPTVDEPAAADDVVAPTGPAEDATANDA